jgi:hypothetical protein
LGKLQRLSTKTTRIFDNKTSTKFSQKTILKTNLWRKNINSFYVILEVIHLLISISKRLPAKTLRSRRDKIHPLFRLPRTSSDKRHAKLVQIFCSWLVRTPSVVSISKRIYVIDVTKTTSWCKAKYFLQRRCDIGFTPIITF